MPVSISENKKSAGYWRNRGKVVKYEIMTEECDMGRLGRLSGWQRLWLLLSFLWFFPVVFIGISDFSNSSNFGEKYIFDLIPKLPDRALKILSSQNVSNELKKKIFAYKKDYPEYNDVEEVDFLEAVYAKEYAGKTSKDDFYKELEEKWKFKVRPKQITPLMVKTINLTAETSQSDADFLLYSVNDVIRSDINNKRLIYSIQMLALWLVPSIALYLLGMALKWVYVGFREQKANPPPEQQGGKE
jgi:hypothetical protein